MNKALKLFLTFLKIGTITFGGGYAMIPIIHREIVEDNGWVTDEEILDIFAIAESTPGPVAINSATYIGYKIDNLRGAVFSTLGVVLPSFIIISIISLVFNHFINLEVVSAAFAGIRIAVIVLITSAIIKLSKSIKKSDLTNIIIFICALVLGLFFGVNSIIILLGSMVVGIIYCTFKAKKEAEK